MRKQNKMSSARPFAAGPRANSAEPDDGASNAADQATEATDDRDPAAKRRFPPRPFVTGTAKGAWIETDWAGDPDEYEGPGDDDDAAQDSGDLPAVIETVPGHSVMDRSKILEALQSSGFDGRSYDSLSPGEEQRVRSLVQYKKMNLHRPHLVGSPAMVERLAALDSQAPNFTAITQFIRRAAQISSLSGSPLRIPGSILMRGLPGIGKSRYVRLLAEAIGTSCHIVNGSMLPDVASLTGYPPVWRGAGPGRLAKFLIVAKTTSPIIFVDEAKKLQDTECNGSSPLDRLLPILERDTAETYQDENLLVPMRAHNALILFACNDTASMSQPFLDRVIQIACEPIAPALRDAAYVAMLGEVSRVLGMRISFASAESLEPLRELGMRRTRTALEIAVGVAVEQNRRFLTRADIATAAALLRDPGKRSAIGFVPPRDADRE